LGRASPARGLRSLHRWQRHPISPHIPAYSSISACTSDIARHNFCMVLRPSFDHTSMRVHGLVRTKIRLDAASVHRWGPVVIGRNSELHLRFKFAALVHIRRCVCGCFGEPNDHRLICLDLTTARPCR
jgi:hypothetical protein